MTKKKKTAKSKKHEFNNDPFNHLKGFVASNLENSEQKGEETVSLEPSHKEVSGSFADEMGMLGVKRLNQADEVEDEGSACLIPASEIADKDEDKSDHALFLAAMGDFSVTFEDSYAEEQPRLGAMPKRIKQLKQGRLVPDASLDLHGFKRAEVVEKINHFLQNARHHGWQTLLVITGKGLHSEAGEPTLRNEVERYLSAEGKKQVIEWSRAPRQYGGDGALVLFLSKK
ncbi:MAG: Smr/MutS family protein [Desulfuromusa sp.]|nr:Smr/MutS family protein [Desulfuromusa sp.]